MALAIARRYASALADVVTRPVSTVSPQSAFQQLESFHTLLRDSVELGNALTSPTVEPASKRRIIQALGERMEFSEPVRNFLFVVMDHRRLRLLGEMIEAFRSLLDDRLGIARIDVIAAQPIDETQRGNLIQKFSWVTKRDVQARFDVDAELLGGAVVRHGSTVYDGSIRAQLRALDRFIAGET